jgi:tryptophan-rich sensory protein
MNINKLIIITPLMIGWITSFNPDEWYKKLKKPNYIPPSYVFGIVWTILYLCLGTSYYIALKNKSISYWILPTIHLLFNFSYSISIFRYRQLRESMLICFMTLITGLIITYLFYIYDKSFISVYLLIPYLFWLFFASFLSYKLYQLNINS